MKPIDNFKGLNETERDHLEALPVYISVLIAGADGTIDSTEMKKAAFFSKDVEKSKNERIKSFYSGASQDFEDKLRVVIANLPRQKEEGKKFLLSQLEKSNTILRKLDNIYARELCESFRALAKNIAAASGGFLGIGSIGSEELNLIDLNMIEYPPIDRRSCL